MSISTTYPLNVALHAVILSVFASLALMGLRQARHRSVVAIAGLLAISFLPWLTALRPARPIDAPAPEIARWQAGDSRWMILFTCIRCLHWWNPLVHRLVSNWADAREQLCGLAATGISDSRADYGEFLIAMACKISKQPPLAVAMAKQRHAGRLKRRIVFLLESGTDAAKPLGKGFIGMGSALVVAGATFVSVLRIGAEEAKDLSPKITEIARAPEPSPSTQPGKAPEPRSAVKWTAGPKLKFTTRMLFTPVKPAVKEGTLPNDHEVQLHMRSLSQKKGVYLMTTSEAKSGKVRLNAVYIDLPRDPKPPANQRYFKKLSPVTDDSLNALVKRHQLEKRKLKQVDIPLNRPNVPWPEFPEIRLSAIVSEDMATFALTNDSGNSGTSSVTPMSSGDMVHIDVQSGNPTIERRAYITAVLIK